MKKIENNINSEFRKLPDNIRIAVIVAKFNSDITERLLSGVKNALDDIDFFAGNNDALVFDVPGSVELAPAAAVCAESGKYAAIICLGAVIRGDTDHYDYVCRMAADGIGKISLDYKLPVMFGVLTCDTLKQAEERSRNDKSNTGYQTALAALDMIETINAVKTS